MCSLAGGAGLPAGLTLEVLDGIVERRSNLETAWNCNWMASLDSWKDNRYEVDPRGTSAYRSFQSTFRL